VLPSLKVPVAVNWWEELGEIILLLGVMEMDVKTGGIFFGPPPPHPVQSRTTTEPKTSLVI
jgi:hypothetical protein